MVMMIREQVGSNGFGAVDVGGVVRASVSVRVELILLSSVLREVTSVVQLISLTGRLTRRKYCEERVRARGLGYRERKKINWHLIRYFGPRRTLR